MKKRGFQLQEFTVDNFLSLMDIYMTDRVHRVEMLWDHVFKFFYATLIVLFLPNLASFIGINLPNFPPVLFPSVALVMSLTFLFISIGLAKKVEASVKTYKKMLEFLPTELQKIPIWSPDIKMGKYYKWSFSTPVCCLMFLSLSVISIIMILYNSHL